MVVLKRHEADVVRLALQHFIPHHGEQVRLQAIAVSDHAGDPNLGLRVNDLKSAVDHLRVAEDLLHRLLHAPPPDEVTPPEDEAEEEEAGVWGAGGGDTPEPPATVLFAGPDPTWEGPRLTSEQLARLEELLAALNFARTMEGRRWGRALRAAQAGVQLLALAQELPCMRELLDDIRVVAMAALLHTEAQFRVQGVAQMPDWPDLRDQLFDAFHDARVLPPSLSEKPPAQFRSWAHRADDLMKTLQPELRARMAHYSEEPAEAGFWTKGLRGALVIGNNKRHRKTFLGLQNHLELRGLDVVTSPEPSTRLSALVDRIRNGTVDVVFVIVRQVSHAVTNTLTNVQPRNATLILVHGTSLHAIDDACQRAREALPCPSK